MFPETVEFKHFLGVVIFLVALIATLIHERD